MIQEEKRDHRKEENDPYKIKKKPKPFAPESSLMYYMTKAGWVIILNIVFLISCLPVFTIGTAVTSFYYAMMKSIRRDRSYPLLEYWSSFKRTFVKGSPMSRSIESGRIMTIFSGASLRRKLQSVIWDFRWHPMRAEVIRKVRKTESGTERNTERLLPGIFRSFNYTGIVS